MREKKTGFWETFILFAIVLVILQTLLEEVAVTAGWTVRVRHFLAFSGLFFDVVFTIEYLVRQTLAAVRRQGMRYFFRERGWIDLLSSVPLLLLDSLPRTLAIVLGSDSAAECVPSVPPVDCSAPIALEWDEAFKKMNDPSGRAVASVHEQAYEKPA